MTSADRRWNLPSPIGRAEREQLQASLFAPLVSLATAVGRFETPFEYLRYRIAGFSPRERFVLTQAELGDSDAGEAREARAAMARMTDLREADDPQPEARLREFFKQRDAEYRRFSASHYPWLELDPYDLDTDATTPDPRLDEYIDAVVLERLKEFGFVKRRARKTHWLATSDILPLPLSLLLDKGSRGSIRMEGYLEVDELVLMINIGYPFFFSSPEFTTSRRANVRHQLELFFTEFSSMFPHIAVALDESITVARTYLESRSR